MLKQDKHTVKVGNCYPNIVITDNSALHIIYCMFPFAYVSGLCVLVMGV